MLCSAEGRRPRLHTFSLLWRTLGPLTLRPYRLIRSLVPLLLRCLAAASQGGGVQQVGARASGGGGDTAANVGGGGGAAAADCCQEIRQLAVASLSHMATAAGASGGVFWAAVLEPPALGAAATAGVPPCGPKNTALDVQLLQCMAVHVLQAELACCTAAPSLSLLAAAASLLSHPALWRRSPPPTQQQQHKQQHNQDNSGPGGVHEGLSAGRRAALDAALSYYVQIKDGIGSTDVVAAALVLLPVLAAAVLPAQLPYGSKHAGSERVPYSPHWEQALPAVLRVAASSQVLTPPAAASASATASAPVTACAAPSGNGNHGAGIGVVGRAAAAVAASAAAASCGGGAGGAVGGAGAECAGWGLIAASGWVVLRVVAPGATHEQLQLAVGAEGLAPGREAAQGSRATLQHYHQYHRDRLHQAASLLVAQAASTPTSATSSPSSTALPSLSGAGSDWLDPGRPDVHGGMRLPSLLDAPW